MAGRHPGSVKYPLLFTNSLKHYDTWWEADQQRRWWMSLVEVVEVHVLAEVEFVKEAYEMHSLFYKQWVL